MNSLEGQSLSTSFQQTSSQPTQSYKIVEVSYEDETITLPISITSYKEFLAYIQKEFKTPAEYLYYFNGKILSRILSDKTLSVAMGRDDLKIILQPEKCTQASTSPGFQLIPGKRKLDFNFEPLKRQKTFCFPVDSVSDFKNLRDQGFFYADKTKYIKDIESDQNVLMFLRPKRFGKSLLLSTLKYFYDINEAPNFDRLFSSLDIYQHASELQHNKFLILEWDFSKIKSLRSLSILETNQRLKTQVNMSIKKFCQAYAPLLGKSSEDLQKSIIDQGNCITSLERLFLEVNYSPYKIYLLIDEYDAITNEFLHPTDVVSYRQLPDKLSLLEAVFATIKDHCSKKIERVFMTGVFPLSMDDGVDIRFDISLIPKYEHLLGLHEEDIRRGLNLIFSNKVEMDEVKKQSMIDAHLRRMRQCYNGYKFQFQATGDKGIYSTNLCLDYLQRLLMGHPIPLVDSNNELDESLLMFVGKHPDAITLLSILLEYKEAPFLSTEIQETLRLPDLIDIQNQTNLSLESFLFYVGALTFSDKPNYLRVPNLVITKTVIERIIQLCYIGGLTSDDFKYAMDNFFVNDNIDSCHYLEGSYDD